MISLNSFSSAFIPREEYRPGESETRDLTVARGKDSFVLTQPAERNQSVSPIAVLPIVVSLALVLGAAVLVHGKESPGAQLIDLSLKFAKEGEPSILRVWSRPLPRLYLRPREGSHIGWWPAFQMGEPDHALTTSGMSVCCALGAVGERQYLAHVDSLISVPNLIRHLRGVGIDRMEGELGIVPGSHKAGTAPLNVLTALGDIDNDLRSRVQFYHFPERAKNGERTVYLYRGRLFRPFRVLRDFEINHQIIPEQNS